MVNEREPPKVPSHPSQENERPSNREAPEFGRPSPLGPTRINQRHPFNIPKMNRPRPEHHRPAPTSSQTHKDKNTLNPFQAAKPSTFQTFGSSKASDDDVVEIFRPTNFDRTSRPAPSPVFSSKQSVPKMGKSTSNLKSFVDLTTTTKDTGFSTNNSQVSEFASADAYSYIDVAKANENIKALLEGAFEDEDDKPKTRSRKKKAEKQIDDLAQQLQGIGMNESEKAGKEKTDEKTEKKREVEEEEEEEDEEEDDGSVEGLKVKLLPHQIDGVDWMKDKETGQKKTRGVLPKGGILADDMGLGKTIQTIALLLTNPRPAKSDNSAEKGKSKDKKTKIPDFVGKGTLVVAPLALIKQWEAEIETRVEYSHRLSVCVYHGAGRKKYCDELDRFDVVITTYGTLSSEHAKRTGCFANHWYRIVLDEAHTIKNRNAKATQAVYALDSLYRWCLSGTPMQNNLDELQSLIRFLRIKPYDELAAWRDQITRPMNNGRGGLAVRRLQVYLKAFMKRRTKDVLKLAEKSDNESNDEADMENKKPSSNGFKITKRDVLKVEADFTDQEREFYQRLEMRTDKSLEQMMGRESLNYAGALVLLLRLRQACNHPDLVKGELAKEKDALIGDVGSQSKGSKNDDMDNIADMLGGLTVATKRCDICQIELTKQQSIDGAVRCTECEADLEIPVIGSDKKVKSKKSNKKKQKKKEKRASTKPSEEKLEQRQLDAQKARSRRNRPIVIDSDDEDEEDGEWIVPDDQRPAEDLGTTGGAEDENAEGGGDWLGTDDSETDEDEDDEDSVSEEESDEDEDSEPNAIDGIQTSTKIRHLMRILKREAGDHKFIVFSFFTSMLDKIEPFLKNTDIGYARYDGGMRNDLREASLNRLRTSRRTRVLLCSLRAGSLGLNLTAASRVVILEPFWNPFVEEQAIDRVHRLNQTVDVKVYKMTIKDTVEARIIDLQDRKRELANATIEGKASAGKLTMQDMVALFGREAESKYSDDHGLKFAEKGRLLSSKDEGEGDATVSTGGGNNSRGSSQGRKGGGSQRSTPPVMEKRKGGGGGGAREDPIYGRRW